MAHFWEGSTEFVRFLKGKAIKRPTIYATFWEVSGNHPKFKKFAESLFENC